jgi:TolB-like protein/DNA-binding winged helix-turn-helix (wHTH) protein
MRLPPRFGLGDLVVDLGQASVTRRGETIGLPGLSFDLLVALAAAAPDLVTPDELMRRVWHGVIVSSETVGQRVKLLRDALGDDHRHPRYVAGVRGRGYRSINTVVPMPGVPRTNALVVRTERADLAAAFEPPKLPLPAEPVTATPSPEAAIASAAGAALGRWARWLGLAIALGVAAAAALLPRTAWLFDAEREAAVMDASAPSYVPGRGTGGATSVDVVGETVRTVAVLPFENLSADPANASIGRGVAAMVLNRLAGSPSLFVVARNSSFAFQNRDADAREIGRELGARYLVQGTVQRSGEQLRVTASVVDGATGRQLKVLRFDRPTKDLFLLQDEIAAAVARALDVSFAPTPLGTTNLEAHLEYLQGMAALGKWQLADAKRAVAHFLRAQRLDPQFAEPCVGEGEARRQIALFVDDDVRSVAPLLAELAARALALSPHLGAAYVLRSLLQEDPAAAEADLRRGIGFAPNYGEGYYRLATRLAQQPGRRVEAMDLYDRAIAVDPMRVRYRFVRAVEAFQDDGDVAALETRLLETLRIDPAATLPLEQLARSVAAYEGRYSDGLRYAERALALDPAAPFARRYAAELYFTMGDYDAGREVAADPRAVSPVAIAAAVASGDMRAAGALAMTPVAPPGGAPPAPVNAQGTLLEVAIVTAIAAEAVRTREFGRALDVLQAQHCPRDPSIDCAAPGTVVAAISMGQLQMLDGDRERGKAQVERALDALRSTRHAYGQPPSALALALAVLGRREDALRTLAAMSPRHAITWWALLERHPGFDAIRTDPRFRAALEAARQHAGAERAKLEAMRRVGTVPSRGARSPG